MIGSRLRGGPGGFGGNRRNDAWIWPGWFGYPDEIEETAKLVDHKHVSFAAIVALWTLVTLLITLANSRTPKAEIHRRH